MGVGDLWRPAVVCLVSLPIPMYTNEDGTLPRAGGGECEHLGATGAQGCKGMSNTK